ncbi:flagellar biosynthesis protein FlhF [Vibrio metschnikovii]|uniref:Flagellar biosynthesis protein FlhF n=4 Tax=Unclassified Bacteria TaxID=49928 RepID=A0AAU6SVC5_UNCXX|nr:flagellar biosynthesis protein FlhF [Vibrio metschnikovii]EKO3595614.1 flagellar biosynthesis protein FlhF [Vibrio metschnikovii]EKO3609112.1 flagellar biosynthesis protein FlhF [Vibrio metschnikovii]EKO3620321.1 flagellar biosynthesis protein FlhF [Vibrio metschnikovii]EKO3623536.1 flagellar biosynthesis protein FlhF [Vibrio metschnikovii]
MKIKRFFAKDMRMALLQVKEELGADAVIMSNKKVAGGVEIVAAVDADSASSAPTATKQYRASPAQYDNRKPSPSTRNSARELEDDRVSLKASNANGASMTQRFASMLKQYSQTPDTEHRAENEDSLTALLQRNQTQTAPNRQLANESALAKLMAEEHPTPRQRPRLDSSRYEPKRDNEPTLTQQELESMREEMNSIRRLLEHQVSGLMWQEVERREPLRAMLIKRLERMGLSLELADQLACYIPEETPPPKAWKALLGLVSDQIPVVKKDILQRGGVVALLGPTGVGKTTTVAKLAARAAMEYGSDNVALITTDTYRIGAHEQLSIYGRIMGCPVRVAKDSKELADVIHQLRNRRLILVDTAGMGQRDVRLSEQLDTLMQESDEVIHSYLVLPATAQRKVLQETIEHFRRIPLSGCIMTKLDECLSLGEFVSVVVQNALPVAYIANGQRVPEDIVIAQPKYMVAKANELLEKSTENEPHYWNSDSERF